ncbi:hypothetical protein [Mastigocoleus testarum]|uniref:Uncharacterized protein n=1 Tax=Mastigocoleus testarum BC008 TaxID=371196 RepID=A0A0V7ZUG3_9CYAN|nr:hypothetical protein [Mastigocoleus testarum]KST68091.1 hypothetical protein BC008_00145 [Mastigocoleus testarum BC008]
MDLKPTEIKRDLYSEIKELDEAIYSGKSAASQAHKKIKVQIRQNTNIKNVNTTSNQSINNAIDDTNETINLDSASTENIKSGIKDLNSPEIRRDLDSEIKAIRQDYENFQLHIQESKQIVNNSVGQLKNSIEKLRHYQDIQKHSSSAVQDPVETGNETEKDNIIQTYHNQKESHVPELKYPEDAIKYVNFLSNEESKDSIKESQTNKDILETSSTRIMSATESLEKPLKSLINSELKKLQLEIKLLQAESNAYKAILQERIKNEPKKITFWQDLKSNLSQIATDMKNAVGLHIKEFNKNSEGQKHAKALLKLFHSQSKDNTYEGKNYRITKENGIYTVNSINDNRQVMQFRSSITGTKIIQANLNQKDIQALKSLSNHVRKIPHTKQSNVIPTSFQEFGKSDSQRFVEINKIADALSEYAKFKGHPVSIQGKKSNYNWQADLQGNITIEHKDKVILQIKDGHTYDAMEPRDITFFQNSLPALQQIIKQDNTQNSSHTNTDLLPKVKKLAQTINKITQDKGKSIHLTGNDYSIISNKENIQIFRKQGNQLIFNYSHKSNKITENSMTIQDVSNIENKLTKISLPKKQQNTQISNNKGLSLE